MTKKQIQMMALLGQGLPRKEIAYQLGLAERSVATMACLLQRRAEKVLQINILGGLHFRMVCKKFTDVLAS
jgi:FixJ family two-component response regulator